MNAKINEGFVFLIHNFTLSYYGISYLETMGYEFHMFGFQPTNLSLILISSGIILHIHENIVKKIFGNILMFFGTLIHPVIGLLYCIGYGLSIFRLSELKKFLYYILIVLVIPFLIILQFLESSELSTKEFNEIYIYLRHPHHFLISEILSDTQNLIKAIISILIILIPYFITKLNRYLIIPSFLIASVILQYTFIEIYPIKIFSVLGLNRIYFFYHYLF